MLIQENVPLAPLTTLQVGGASRYFVEAHTPEEVREAVDISRSLKLPLFVLGGGSNLVVSDKGWPGLTLKIGISGIQERNQNGRTLFDVGAGEEWDKFVVRAVVRQCSGVECLSGIPGSVGGTPVQNVGAYGQEVAETIDSVLAFNLEDSQTYELSKVQCEFGYRSSIFNTSGSGRFIVLRATYSLTPGGQPRLEYADLKKYFSGWSSAPNLAETREAVRQIRAGKGMLLVPGNDDCRSVGSFFKNPVLAAEPYQELSALAAEKGLRIPSYPALDAQRKISAAWLVEHSGFRRGYGNGRVGLSSKHALAIINRGGACAAEVIGLKAEIQHRVQEIWGIELQPEPVFIGF